MSSVRIIVADDHALLRAGLVALLNAVEEFDVVGDAADGRSALEMARELRPDVALLDVRMPYMSGIDITRELRHGHDSPPHTAVVILTTFDDDDTLFSALDAGASGFVLKDDRSDEIIGAVRAAYDGTALLSPGVTLRVVQRAVGRRDKAPHWQSELTARETEVLTLVSEGLSNDVIATRLHIEATTVKSHVRSLLRKMGGRNRIDLVLAVHHVGRNWTDIEQ